MSAPALPQPAIGELVPHAAAGAAPARRAPVLRRVVAYVLRDVARSRWLLAYAAFFLIATESLLRYGGGGPRALLSLVNVVLLLLPLVGVLFGTMYLYSAREFIELLLAQPVARGRLFGGLYLGLALPLVAAFAVGTTLPFVLHPTDAGTLRTLAALVVVGALLTAVFVAIAFLLALRFEERVTGLGAAIALWLAAAVLYDAGVLFVATALADYPLEGPMLGLMLLNPIDLARVALLLQFDISALMGYTGAVFQRAFGGVAGTAIAGAALLLWAVVPFLLGLRAFRRKDF